MLQMSQYYEPEFKKKIVRLHLEEGRINVNRFAAYFIERISYKRINIDKL